MRAEAQYIIRQTIQDVLPDRAVREQLNAMELRGKVYLAAIGKAAWVMAETAAECLGDRLEKGVVVTKYDHVKGEIPRMVCFEAGHPVPDKNSFLGTEAVLDMVKDLTDRDRLIRILPSVQMPWRL